MTTLTRLEQEVLGAILAGDHSVLVVLRQQMEHLKVSSREFTGVGFVTRFVVGKESPRLGGKQSFRLGDVAGEADDVKHGLGFLLFVEGGLLSSLEGYTYDEPWPREVRGLKLSYLEGPARNLEVLRRLVH